LEGDEREGEDGGESVGSSAIGGALAYLAPKELVVYGAEPPTMSTFFAHEPQKMTPSMTKNISVSPQESHTRPGGISEEDMVER
jgi:hypothetical protein